MQSQEMICAGRYLSCDDTMRVFAAGNLTNQMRLEVRWRSGKRSVLNGVRANRIYEIDEAGAELLREKTKNPELKPVFEDVSQLIQHKHQDEAFDDFQRQPLLPNKLSQLGPGVAWYDVNGDGREDLVIGSGKGGALAVYLNDDRGLFRPLQMPALQTRKSNRSKRSTVSLTKRSASDSWETSALTAMARTPLLSARLTAAFADDSSRM